MSVYDREEVRDQHNCRGEQQATELPATSFDPFQGDSTKADQGKGKNPRSVSRLWDAWRRKRVRRYVAKGISKDSAKQIVRREAAAHMNLALTFGDAAMLSAEARISSEMKDGSVLIFIRFSKLEYAVTAFPPDSIERFL